MIKKKRYSHCTSFVSAFGSPLLIILLQSFRTDGVPIDVRSFPKQRIFVLPLAQGTHCGLNGPLGSPVFAYAAA